MQCFFDLVSVASAYKCIFLLMVSALLLSVPACSNLDKARTATDVVVANKKNFNLQALLEAEIERQRVRKLRCHSSLLNPSAVSGAAYHPSLGREWVDELLRDCPDYAAFVADLVLRRAQDAGLTRFEGARGRLE